MSFQESLGALSRALGQKSRGPERRRAPRRSLDVAFTVLDQDRFGGIRPVSIDAVDVSDRGIAFRAEWEFAVGQNLLVSDGQDVIEVVVRSKREEDGDLVYGAELIQSAELPDNLVSRVPESYGRLAEEMELEGKRVSAGIRTDA